MDFSILTDIGSSSVNEDYADAMRFGDYYVFALADGLGGHGGGDLASRSAVESVMQTASKERGFSVELMARCFQNAQNNILELQKTGGRARASKTTLVVLMTDGHTAIWGHIGDSRLYWFRNRRLKSRTLDHSVSQTLVASKKIKPEELNHHEDRSMLLHALGARWQSEEDFEIDCTGTRVKPGDVFLLCSDGLWEWFDEKKTSYFFVPQEKTKSKLEQLVKHVKTAGVNHEFDNLTGLLVNI